MSANPYLVYLATVEKQLYVPMFKGYKARLWIMIGLVTYALLVALLFIALTVRDLRKKNNLWVWRVIERPQGRYLIVNQYLYYPFGTAVTSIIWLPYARYLQLAMVDHIPAQQCFYWVYLHVIPAFCHAYLTTIIVLGSANLIVTRGSSRRHLLPSWVSNGLFVLLPALVVVLAVPAVLAGTAWKRFVNVWEALGEDARIKAMTATPMSAEQFQTTFSGLMMRYRMAITPPVDEFDAKSHTASIVALVAISFVIVINLIGAVTLVFRLGRSGNAQIVPRDAPVVAPLAPLVLTPSSEEKKLDLESDDIAEVPLPLDDATPKAEKLPWTVTLFYLCTIPFSVVFVLYASWIISPATPFATPGAETEFGVTGIVGAKSLLDAVSITALLIKRLSDARKPVLNAAEIPIRPFIQRGASSDELGYPNVVKQADEEPVARGGESRSLMQIVAGSNVRV